MIWGKVKYRWDGGRDGRRRESGSGGRGLGVGRNEGIVIEGKHGGWTRMRNI